MNNQVSALINPAKEIASIVAEEIASQSRTIDLSDGNLTEFMVFEEIDLVKVAAKILTSSRISLATF